jgi:hypothetical protein
METLPRLANCSGNPDLAEVIAGMAIYFTPPAARCGGRGGGTQRKNINPM